MKWFLLWAAVSLGTFALLLAVPKPLLFQTRDVMQHALDTIVATFRPVMDRTTERVDRMADKVCDRAKGPEPETFRADPNRSTLTASAPRPGPETFRADLSGIARVLDGDTIEIGPDRIRLWGVDAPEGKQTCLDGRRRWPCGRRATRALARQIDGRSVACEERDRDGRIVAVCRRGGRDINAWLVREGWALAFRRYSQAYVAEESEARAARRGLWRGEFVRPWDWRRGQRLQTANRDDRRVSSRNRGACDIKGNISRNSGERIYHVPGDPDYAATRISPSHGERWFCTESEARAAGWRRAGRRFSARPRSD